MREGKIGAVALVVKWRRDAGTSSCFNITQPSFMIRPSFFPFISALLLAHASAGGVEPISFSQQIAPILQAKCVACHGPKLAESDYRLDTFASLVIPATESQPIVAGSPSESELYRRLVADDEAERMPAEAEPLSDEQVSLIRLWIQQGARFDGDSRSKSLTELSPSVVHGPPPESYPRPMPISAVAFSKDSKQLFIGGYHEITVWSGEGKLLRRIHNQGERTYSLSFHPQNPWLLSASGTPGVLGEVRIFDLASGDVRAIAVKTSETILDAKFNSDGSRLAVAMPDGSVSILNSETLKVERQLLGHSDQVTSLTWHTDGVRLISTSRDHTAKIFDTGDGQALATFTGHTGAVHDACFLNDTQAISAGSDGQLLAWSTKDGRKERDIVRQKTPLLSITRLQEHYLVTGTTNTQLFETESHRKIETIPSEADWITASASDPAKQLAVTGSLTGQIIIRDHDREVARFTAKP
jgi:hypothetical protein